MKRLYIFGVGIVGALAALYFLSQGGVFDYETAMDTVQSYLRRLQLSFVGGGEVLTGQDDAFGKAVALIAGFEGFSATAYRDANGYSIGYGHFITSSDPYDENSTISENDAYNLLQSDAQAASNCVDGAVTVDLSDNQRAALISLAYNIGCGAFQGSTLLRLLNAGDYDGAAGQFAAWNKSGGSILSALVGRRSQEAEVFNT